MKNDRAADKKKKNLITERRAALSKKFAAGKKLSHADMLEIGINQNNDNIPTTVQGPSGIARLIADTFKVNCARQSIQQWMRRDLRPFPRPHNGNFFSVSRCLDWYREEVQKSALNGEHDLFQRAATEKARGEIAAEEHKEWERQVQRGAWIKKADHSRALAAAARIVQTLFDREVETDGPKSGAAELLALGVSATIIETWQQKMKARGIKWTDLRRRQFAKKTSTP